MRFGTRAIELEAVRYDGATIAGFADRKVVRSPSGRALLAETGEGERQCSLDDDFGLTHGGPFPVRSGALFETVSGPIR